MTAEEMFWDLIEPMYADPAVCRSTMMGLPCVRIDGRFFASLDRRTGALLVKLPAGRVADLIASGHGQPFAPAGRAFREWVAVIALDRERWHSPLAEARDHVADLGQPPRQRRTPLTQPRRHDGS
jgi:hypothetical protein